MITCVLERFSSHSSRISDSPPSHEIDIGKRLPAVPVTPPCVRVCTRRFRDLSPYWAEGSQSVSPMEASRSQVPVGLHPIHPWEAQPRLIDWRMATHEIRALLLPITVRAFTASAATMPSADFCRAIRTPCDVLSHHCATHGRSPKVSSTAFSAQPPDLRSAPLMDMGFAVSCLLARRSRLKSGSCPSARAFAPRFLQTPPHDDALAVR